MRAAPLCTMLSNVYGCNILQLSDMRRQGGVRCLAQLHLCHFIPVLKLTADRCQPPRLARGILRKTGAYEQRNKGGPNRRRDAPPGKATLRAHHAGHQCQMPTAACPAAPRHAPSLYSACTPQVRPSVTSAPNMPLSQVSAHLSLVTRLACSATQPPTPEPTKAIAQQQIRGSSSRHHLISWHAAILQRPCARSLPAPHAPKTACGMWLRSAWRHTSAPRALLRALRPRKRRWRQRQILMLL